MSVTAQLVAITIALLLMGIVGVLLLVAWVIGKGTIPGRKWVGREGR